MKLGLHLRQPSGDRLRMAGYGGSLSTEPEDMLPDSQEGLEASMAHLERVMPARRPRAARDLGAT